MKCRFIALSAAVTERGQKEISDILLMTDFQYIGASPAKENITLILSRRPYPKLKGNCSETTISYIFSPVLEGLFKEQEFPYYNYLLHIIAVDWLWLSNSQANTG
ncbi:hypothetical protein DPMN_148960 [Dreissena polymorpha]|uniref:Uncharacterized protein n=1 Tax=Dreissena polymorpha TaxID=45954 RepID=A0A9D4J213_DREPO|nr:hypothetical protein DPMN_148960 [Dreissena polymorpha]